MAGRWGQILGIKNQASRALNTVTSFGNFVGNWAKIFMTLGFFLGWGGGCGAKGKSSTLLSTSFRNSNFANFSHDSM